MIRFIFPIVALTSIMSMVACSGRDPVADDANTSGPPAEIDVLPPDEGSVPATNELNGATGTINDNAAAASGKIPASLHGRWGLTPGDCTSSRADNKGLLVVSADGLKFYESLGKPNGELKVSNDSVSGDFAFSGEGMTWKKFEVLELQGGKLVRTESGPMQSFAYARCQG